MEGPSHRWTGGRLRWVSGKEEKMEGGVKNLVAKKCIIGHFRPFILREKIPQRFGGVAGSGPCTLCLWDPMVVFTVRKGGRV